MPRSMLPRELAVVLLGAGAFFLVTCLLMLALLEDLDSSLHSGGAKGRRHRKAPGNANARADYALPSEPAIESAVRAMRKPTPPTAEALDYRIDRCPDEIPPNYPVQWSVGEVLSNWNPDDTDLPDQIYQGLCSLDWKDPHQRDLAEAYREAELPFLVQNHPEVWKTAERWSHYEYLHDLLGGEESTYRNEYNAHGNHMPYWKLRGKQKTPWGWKPPTENVELSFPEWYSRAQRLDADPDVTEAEHYYFRLTGVYRGQNAFLYDELPIFDFSRKSFFMPDPDGQRGINCRFGSRGTIAETHYDFSRNFILILKGQKRYVLASPDQCPNLELHPMGHPSARHSRVDWSDPKDWNTGRFPRAQVNEVVLQAGDALYLPTAWFHFIVSLNLNYQCNARSGISLENQRVINDCGFATV